MSMGLRFELDLLKLIFHGEAVPGLTGLKHLYVSLHTAMPGGDQNTNETAYPGYARVAVARDLSGWQIDAGKVAPVKDINFQECLKESSAVLTHFAVGIAAKGIGSVLYRGTIDPSVKMKLGMIPRLKAVSSNVATIN